MFDYDNGDTPDIALFLFYTDGVRLRERPVNVFETDVDVDSSFTIK